MPDRTPEARREYIDLEAELAHWKRMRDKMVERMRGKEQ